MSRYGSVITLRQQCECEVGRMRATLRMYEVPEREVRKIADMICEGYYHAIDANAAANVLEEKLIEEMGKDGYVEFARPLSPDGYLSRKTKYREKHPELFLDEEEENEQTTEESGSADASAEEQYSGQD